MKLPHPFYRLSLCFDAERLRSEVSRLSEECWFTHPNGYPGNASLVLVSVGGTVNDDFAIAGPMKPTALLMQCPYLMQVLASLRAPISRTRLMRLAGQAQVPKHRDLSYHWYRRTRVHIPIVTHPSVQFVCDKVAVHMAAGQAWTFDNFRPHEVLNPHEESRVHLVIDTRGSDDFWNQTTPYSAEATADFPPQRLVTFQPDEQPQFQIEPYQFEVLGPHEIDALVADIGAQVDRTPGSTSALSDFRRRWKEAYAQHGNHRSGEMAYAALIGQLRSQFGNEPLRGDAESALRVITGMLSTTNRTVEFSTRTRTRQVSESTSEIRSCQTGRRMDWQTRYLKSVAATNSLPPVPTFGWVLDLFSQPTNPRQAYENMPAAARRTTDEFAQVVANLRKLRLLDPVAEFQRPVFIVSAPRSGSTLLFESLSQVPNVWTIGGESHAVMESLPSLHPRHRNWSSNRLTAADADWQVANHLRAQFTKLLRDRSGQLLSECEAIGDQPYRLLAKTPKDALRIPFLKAAFPDAQFIFLYREPQSCISSIMEGWRSRRFVTYASLPGWKSMPWSFLLPPGWQDYRSASLAEIAAFQWQSANQNIWQDLVPLSADDWCVIHYDQFVTYPQQHVLQLCKFAGWEMDESLREYLHRPLPLSRYTLSEPVADKWRKNEADIRRVLPLTHDVAQRIHSAQVGPSHVLL